MKRWSIDEAAQATGGTAATVRSARFDRPLRHGANERTGSWAGDVEVDRQVRAAIEEGRKQGLAAGYAAGWAQGRQAAAEQEQVAALARADAEATRRAQEAARLQTVLEGLAQVGSELERSLEPAWHEVADAITEGALRIAAAALGRELAALEAPVLDAVRTAVRTVADPGRGGQIVVRLHPQDHAAVCGPTGAAAEVPLPDGVRLVADHDLSPGEVRAATHSQRLRLHLPTALAAAEEVLRG